MAIQKQVSGTKEWAEHSANICNGCMHDCLYCYAKAMAIRFGRKTPDTWKIEDVRPEPARWPKRSGRIMFPTTHDITPATLDPCIKAIVGMLNSGNDLLIVSKPHAGCIQAVCDAVSRWSSHVMFRFTIGSASDAALTFWEPGAPCFSERIESLRIAYTMGYRTSVSCEPMLDGNIGAVVDAVSPYVSDSIWLGKANLLAARLSVNGRGEAAMNQALALMATQSDSKIRELYELHKANPMIRWKESIKRVIGLDIPTVAGLDV